jgi:peptidoglycan/LPS O-acetylase OafA/YrhL
MDYQATSPRFVQSGAHHRVAYRPDIDGLRAVAVMIVVLFHAWPNWLKGGFIGVDIFFVISGFLITSIIVQELKNEKFSIRQFYARRVRRIFPALITVVLATLAFGWYVLLKNEFEQLGKHVLGAATFVSNFVLWNEAGYFDNDHTTKPLLHLWSLGVEEQFYLVWPLMLSLFFRRHAGILLFLAITLAASFLFGLYATYNAPVAAYFSPVTRFWELASGGLVAYLLSRDGPTVRWPLLMSAAGIVLIALGAMLIDGQTPFPGAWAVLPVAGTCALIMATKDSWINKRLLGNPLMVRIGLVSYPFYLWHWPLLSFGYIVLGERPPVEIKALLVLGSLVLAFLTYHLVERPIQRTPKQAKAIKALLASMVCFAIVGTFVARGLVPERIYTNGTEVYLGALNDVGFPVPEMKPLKYGSSVFQQISGAGEGATILIGDSVMEQYAPLVAQGLGNNSFNRKSIIFATAGGCPPIPGAIRLPRIRFPTCGQTVADAYKLAAAPEIDTVVIAAAWNGYFTKSQHDLQVQADGRIEQFPSAQAQDVAQDTLRRAIDQLQKQGKRVFLVQQPPSGELFDPRSMITGSRFGELRPRANFDPMRVDEFRQFHGEPRARVTALARATGATLVDPVDYLCKNGVCPVLNPKGQPIYTDSVHMRPYFVRSAVHYLDDALGRPKHGPASAAYPGGVRDASLPQTP